MRRAIPIVLTIEERDKRTVLARSRTAAARLVTRAKIELAAADGAANKDIVAMLRIREITPKRIRRGSFGSVQQLEQAFTTPSLTETRTRARSSGTPTCNTCSPTTERRRAAMNAVKYQ